MIDPNLLKSVNDYEPVGCPEFSECTWTQIGQEKKSGRPVIRLTKPLVFKLGNGNGITVSIPEGFECDLASSPRILWRVFPPLGKYQAAAIMHDYLYRSKELGSRFLADALFREAMLCLGVPRWKRILMYYAVRLFGGLVGWKE